MDKTISKIIGAVQLRVREQLQGLGDYPKTEPFEHGVQVGNYQGLQAALDVIEKVLSDEENEEARR